MRAAHQLNQWLTLQDASPAMLLSATLVVFVSLALLYWRKQAVGSSRNINVPWLPGAMPVLGHVVAFVRHMSTVHDWTLQKSRQMGYRTFCFSVPLQPTKYFVNDPACLEYILKTEMHNFVRGKVHRERLGPILGHGIFTSDGEDWFWQRKLAANIFNVKSFKRYIDIVFAEELNKLVQLLHAAATSGSPLDLHDLMYCFTLDSFGQIGFGVDPGCMASKAGKVPFAEAFDMAQVITAERYVNPGWRLTELLNGKRATLNRCCSIIHSFALNIVNERRQQLTKAAAAATGAAGAAGGVAACNGNEPAADAAGSYDDGDGSTAQDLLSLFMSVQGPGGKPLDDKQLVDVVINFIIAGRDTTAQALSWTFYELMRHPEVEQRVVAEVKQVLGRDMAAADSSTTVNASYSELRQLRYTHACYMEALRLHPSVPQNIRVAAQQDTLPDGSIIPKGGVICYSPYVVNRMTTFWGPDADQFRPERWLEMDSVPSPYSHLTFSAGSRLCLGQRLAELEGVYVLAGLLARFSFRQVVPGTEVNYTFSVSLPMKEGLHVMVKLRAPSGGGVGK